MDQLLRFSLNAFGHFIQDIGRLVNPATLLGDWAVFIFCGSPLFSVGSVLPVMHSFELD
jgi:hypothetical protein